MPVWPLALRRAGTADTARIIGLIDEAADWLRHKNTDQWANPWPDQVGRDGRIQASLDAGKTWICWDGGTAVATLTADPDPDPYWAQDPPARSAVYVHRLVVSRRYAGLGLGAALLNWAGRTGLLTQDASVVRISA